MTGAYAHALVVGRDAVDGLGHANNVEFVRWMNDAAVAHAEARGWTAAAGAVGAAWVVRAHRVDYLRPAFAGDGVRVLTWVADVRGASSLRRYRIERLADGAVLAEAETDFAFVDAQTGRPRRIPAELKVAYPG